MHKYLLILFAVASEVLCRQANVDVVRETILRASMQNQTVHATDRQEGPSVSTVNMNGNYNYHADQQVFFINGSPQNWRKGVESCVSFLERDDYIIRPGIGAFKYHSRKRVWNAARKSCLDEGGQLAVLNTEQEEKFLIEWIQKENLDRIWLGIHDLFEEGEWVTLTGESLDVAGFEKWSTVWPNQPDNYGGHQNCGALIKEGGLDDVECDAKISYICEITLC